VFNFDFIGTSIIIYILNFQNIVHKSINTLVRIEYIYNCIKYPFNFVYYHSLACSIIRYRSSWTLFENTDKLFLNYCITFTYTHGRGHLIWAYGLYDLYGLQCVIGTIRFTGTRGPYTQNGYIKFCNFKIHVGKIKYK